MNEKDPMGFKGAQATFKDIADFQKEVVGTLCRSHLQATQAILSGYAEVVEKAIAQCDGPATPAPKQKKAAS
jgi:hypothetical protein